MQLHYTSTVTYRKYYRPRKAGIGLAYIPLYSLLLSANAASLILAMAFDQILQFLRFGNAETPLFSCPYLLVLRLVGYYVSISCWAFVNDSQTKYIEIVPCLYFINSTKSKKVVYIRSVRIKRLILSLWNKLNWKSFLACSYSFHNLNCTWKQIWNFPLS